MTPSGPSFADALRQAERLIEQHELPADLERRIRRNLRARESRRPRWLPTAVGLAAVASAAIVAMLFVTARREPEPAIANAAGGFEIASGAQQLKYRVSADATLTIDGGRGELLDRERGIRVAVAGPAAIRRERSGVRIVRGVANIAVTRRGPSMPEAKILVSDGQIAVMGTAFTVDQRDDGGSVVLHEGLIQFIATDGARRQLRPGETLTWPLHRPESTAPPPMPTPRPTAPRSSSTTASPRGSLRISNDATASEELPEAGSSDDGTAVPTIEPATILDAVAKLRSRGQFAEAAALVRDTLETKDLTPSLRETLSFELGTLLTDQLRDASAACAHWNEHRRRFPRGNYATEVDGARRRLACQGDP
ncbi:MAG: hypothetical protein AB7P03_11825 [Kofleriaceae bacterium]